MEKIKFYLPLLALFSLETQDLRFVPYTGADVVQDGTGSRANSWGDIDGDGRLDLFVSNRKNQNNLLYFNKTENMNEPVLLQIKEGDVVNDGGDSQGSSFADYDNDGDLDLYVANRHNQQNFLYKNIGDGRFERILRGEIVTDSLSSTSISWVDIDNDGYLDLFVANRNKQPNNLYINLCNGHFKKLERGPIVEDKEDTRSCSWGDFDNDGDADLIVGNAHMPNSLYINKGNFRFSRKTLEQFWREKDVAYGVSSQDINNDGNLDIFIANFSTSNILLLNDGKGNFIKDAQNSVTTTLGYSKGIVWQDFDNDGDLDLFVSNGTPGKLDDHLFYLNKGSGVFKEERNINIVKHGGYAGGSTSADINSDGKMDLFIANWVDNSNNKLFFNLSGKGNNWIQVDLSGKESPATPYGARVNLYFKENGTAKRFSQHLASQSGYGSQSSPILHFGLGKTSKIDSLVISWPSGNSQTISDLEINKKHKIIEEIQN